MCRPDTVFYAGLVGISGAVTGGDASPTQLGLAWLVPTLAWIASLYGGDYFDRDLDALTKPHRPIPSGRVGARTARTVMILLILTGFALTVAVNLRALLLAGAAAVLGIGYARVFKGRGLSGNIIRGAPTALAFLFGAMVVQPFPAPELAIMAAALWIHDSGSNLLGALGDRDGDRSGGYATYPVARGDDAALTALVRFFIAWVTLVALASVVIDSYRVPCFYLTLLVAVILGAVSLVMVVRAPKPVPRMVCLRAHELIVIERLLLPSAAIVAADRFFLFTFVVAPSIGATVLAAFVMRRSYRLPSPMAA
ncbi:UbiA family prenyltransferase [Antrihabitans spumae]|uniref:UbiA family prenyltransferase n=1 Tax=Antrihabitans spumae TaxID=3373370 RepID=A0ABW7KWN5_9NOCA